MARWNQVQQSGSSAEFAGQAANGIDHAIGNLALSGRDHQGALEHRRLRRSAIAEYRGITTTAHVAVR